MNIDWECLALGKSEFPPRRNVEVARCFRSAAAYLRSRFIYSRRGFPEASSYLGRLQRCFRPMDIASTEEAVRLARREMVPLRIMGRLTLEDHLCLPVAISLTAGLIALGLPAQVVVGKARHYISPNYNFHAWTEINGISINETPQTQRGFYPLLKHPDWGSVGGYSSRSKTKGGDIMTTETKKLVYEKPRVDVIGQMEELTGSGGNDNDDGWGYDSCP